MTELQRIEPPAPARSRPTSNQVCHLSTTPPPPARRTRAAPTAPTGRPSPPGASARACLPSQPSPPPSPITWPPAPMATARSCSWRWPRGRRTLSSCCARSASARYAWSCAGIARENARSGAWCREGRHIALARKRRKQPVAQREHARAQAPVRCETMHYRRHQPIAIQRRTVIWASCGRSGSNVRYTHSHSSPNPNDTARL